MPYDKEKYDKFYKLCREFLIYLEGYERNDGNPLRKLMKLYLDLEKELFGEKITSSWS